MANAKRKVVDCRQFPSGSSCTLVIAGTEPLDVIAAQIDPLPRSISLPPLPADRCFRSACGDSVSRSTM